MLARSLLIAAVLGACVLVPGADAGSLHAGRRGTPIYLNRSYSFAERAADLVSRMTLAEKASQMISSQAPAIPRLGVPAYGWWNEALHGLSRLQYKPSGNATVLDNTTSYPMSLALGASWDPSLMYREATAISDEAREVVPNNSLNLDFYAPTINLGRDPRWGRNDETFSEDPLLTAAIASEYVDGMEGKDQQGNLLRRGGGYLKTVTTIKHYAANNTEGDKLGGPTDRLSGTSNMDARTLREYYTAQFKQIIRQAHPGSIMSAYNAVNGVPAPASVHLTDTLARQTFGFGGYFTSDCDAVYEIYHGHHWQPPGYSRPLDPTEARAFAAAAGEDLNCNAGYADDHSYATALPSAAGQGIRTGADTFSVNDMDASLVRLFTARMQLGEFDHVATEPWVKAARARLPENSWTNSDANRAVTETPARLQLARQVADHGYVLLKNASGRRRDGSVGKLLPIHVPRTGAFRVAVIGFFANPPATYLGGYASDQGAPGAANEVTPFQGIKHAVQAINPSAQVDYYPGFTGEPKTAADLTGIDPAAVAAASSYDAAVVYAGTDDSTASEFTDRTTLALPGAQAQLINDVTAKNPNTVAVLRSIGQVDTGAFAPHLPALLWSSYNGQREGEAIADVLLGAFDPSGHLPFTWYQSANDLPALTDYSIRPGANSLGRTYMYYRGPVSYPFGYGLSYTTFRTAHLQLSGGRLDANDTLHASVEVTNTGHVAGSDLVQLYIATPQRTGASRRPVKRLAGFRQVALRPGQSKRVSFAVAIPSLAFFDPGRRRYGLDDGRYGVQIASSAARSGVLGQRYVTVTGKLIPTLSVVSAKPTMAGDARRGIQQRVIYPEDAVVLPHPTVSMSDERLYGHQDSGRDIALPRGMRVSFSSDRPAVVSAAGSTIRTHRSGVATITATVSYRGLSRSTQFVVRVLSELDRLTVNGHPLTGFYPDTYSYDVLVPSSRSVPRVAVRTPDRRARVSVTQATGVPGTATIVVSAPDGMPQSYYVHFAHPARSDEFSGSDVGPQWSWIRRDPTSEQVARGSLSITSQPGDLAGTANNARNVLVQPALGDWQIESKLSFSAPPHAATQQAGIIAYQDDDNWLKLDWEYSGGAAKLVESTEDSLSGSPVTQVLRTLPSTGLIGNTVWLRLAKRGSRYTAYYSGDGQHFALLYDVGASLSNVEAGLFAYNGAAPNNDLQVSFDYFHVRNSGVVALRPPRRRA